MIFHGMSTATADTPPCAGIILVPLATSVTPPWFEPPLGIVRKTSVSARLIPISHMSLRIATFLIIYGAEDVFGLPTQAPPSRKPLSRAPAEERLLTDDMKPTLGVPDRAMPGRNPTMRCRGIPKDTGCLIPPWFCPLISRAEV